MQVLIACEFSGVVRDAFIRRGHDAWSCDLLPSRGDHRDKHMQCDVLDVLNLGWDLMIGHPPCTHLCVSGARWFKGKEEKQELALQFFKSLLDAPIPKICLENPKGIISTRIRPPDQYIHPWMFGHKESKNTGLWLKNLPLLQPTNIQTKGLHVGKKRYEAVMPLRARGYLRSMTCIGVAEAMADQWGSFKEVTLWG